MPVTKYFARVWSSPKQKEQILFKTDPVLQRPIRVGCCRTSIYVPPVTSYNFNIWTAASGTTFTTSGNGVAYGNDKWVAVGSGSGAKILYSDDGITWSAASGATFTTSGNDVAYADGKWVAVGGNSPGSTIISLDGTIIPGYFT